MEKSIDEIKEKIQQNTEKGKAIILEIRQAEAELHNIQFEENQGSSIVNDLQEKRLVNLARGKFNEAEIINKEISKLNNSLVVKVNNCAILKKKIELLRQDSQANSIQGDALRQELGAIEFNLALDSMLVLFNNLKPHMSKFRENWPFVKGAPERISDEKLSELVSELGLKFI